VANLERRTRHLEEQTEWQKTADRLEAERTFHEALTRVSTSELQAMKEYLDSTDREEWTEEDEPLARRLLELMEEVRRERAEARGQVVDPPWLSKIRGELRDDDH
jgi:hypothetical protein